VKRLREEVDLCRVKNLAGAMQRVPSVDVCIASMDSTYPLLNTQPIKHSN
jgi:hypothetical protein